MGGEGPPASELRLAGGRRWAAGGSCAPMLVPRRAGRGSAASGAPRAGPAPRTGHAPGPTSLDA